MRINFQVYVLENVFTFVFRISKSHVMEFEDSFEMSWPDSVYRILHTRFSIDNFKYSDGSNSSLGYFFESRSQLSQVEATH